MFSNVNDGVPTGASAGAIRRHYDLSDDFYRLWLDPSMTYSCAFWEHGDELAQAQVRKLDHHIIQSGAPQQAHILDIGCGWGSLLARAVAAHGVKRATGLTLSHAQHEYAMRVLPPACEVRMESWADHTPREPYDAVISVGAFEHFARLEHNESEKVACYRQFFAKCRSLLRPGGQLSLQTFAYGGCRSRDLAAASPGTSFLSREIFEETDPPRLANIVEAIFGIFELVALRNDRLDYAKTCKQWLKNLKARREEAKVLVGRDVVEKYVQYLSLAALGFQIGYLDLYRITLRPVLAQGRMTS